MPRRFRGRGRRRQVQRRQNLLVPSGRSSAPVMSEYRRYPGPIEIPLNQSYMIQLRGFFGATTDGSGNIAGMIPCDPSATLSSVFGSVAMFNQWSSWVVLFRNIKCVAFEVKMLPCYTDEVKGDIAHALIVSGNLQAQITASNYGGLSDNTDSQLYNPTLDTASKGLYHSIRHRKSLQWADVNTPVPGGYAGCPGSISFYGAGFPASTQLVLIHVTGTYLLSNRT